MKRRDLLRVMSGSHVRIDASSVVRIDTSSDVHELAWI
jgi:hypothetical protein